MPEFDINYIAVLVAAVGTFAIGALWYSPLLFANAWMKAQGISADDEAKMAEMKASAPKAYGVSLACYLAMAVALSVLIGCMNITDWMTGAKLGLGVGLGFMATMGLTANMFSDKPISLFIIDTGYQLVYMLFMGALLAGWR